MYTYLLLLGDPKKIVHFIRTKTLGTSYSETTYLLGHKLWLQRVLVSTPSCQISTPNRLVVSEYEVPKVFVCIKCKSFFGPPCSPSNGVNSYKQWYMILTPAVLLYYCHAARAAMLPFCLAFLLSSCHAVKMS